MAGEPFYKGKILTAHVGGSAGGTNDLTTRLIAKHIGRLLEGQPTVVVKNMPGAGTGAPSAPAKAVPVPAVANAPPVALPAAPGAPAKLFG